MEQHSLSRRQFGGLALGSAALASFLGSSSNAFAAKATADVQLNLAGGVPPGLFATEFGQYKIYAIMDGMIPMKRGLFSGDEAKITQVLEDSGQTGETIPSPISAFLLKSDKKTVLIDAGLGEMKTMGPGFGNLTKGLALTGTKPSDIDTLIITHAHPDHIGGTMDAEGKVIFTNAEVVLAEAESKFWTDPAIMAKIPEKKQGAFKLAQKMLKAYGDQVSLVAPGKEVAPGIQLKLAAGHTPGHSILHIDGGEDKELLMIADTLHNTELHTAIPDIKFAFDADPAQAAKTRRKIFDQLATDKTLALCSHAHFPGLGRILKHGDVYRYSTASL